MRKSIELLAALAGIAGFILTLILEWDRIILLFSGKNILPSLLSIVLKLIFIFLGMLGGYLIGMLLYGILKGDLLKIGNDKDKDFRYWATFSLIGMVGGMISIFLLLWKY